MRPRQRWLDRCTILNGLKKRTFASFTCFHPEQNRNCSRFALPFINVFFFEKFQFELKHKHWWIIIYRKKISVKFYNCFLLWLSLYCEYSAKIWQHLPLSSVHSKTENGKNHSSFFSTNQVWKIIPSLLGAALIVTTLTLVCCVCWFYSRFSTGKNSSSSQPVRREPCLAARLQIFLVCIVSGCVVYMDVIHRRRRRRVAFHSQSAAFATRYFWPRLENADRGSGSVLLLPFDGELRANRREGFSFLLTLVELVTIIVVVVDLSWTSLRAGRVCELGSKNCEKYHPWEGGSGENWVIYELLFGSRKWKRRY